MNWLRKLQIAALFTATLVLTNTSTPAKDQNGTSFTLDTDTSIQLTLPTTTTDETYTTAKREPITDTGDQDVTSTPTMTSDITKLTTTASKKTTFTGPTQGGTNVVTETDATKTP